DPPGGRLPDTGDRPAPKMPLRARFDNSGKSAGTIRQNGIIRPVRAAGAGAGPAKLLPLPCRLTRDGPATIIRIRTNRWDAMDRVLGMTIFVRVAENSSFAAAARALNMSASTVTLHVQEIEERLGVRLLNRTTRH